MPITQARMIALLTAGEDYQKAFCDAELFSAKLDMMLIDGKIDLPNAWSQLCSKLSSVYVLRHPAESAKVLGVEREHFRLRHRANTRNREWNRKNRDIYKPGRKQRDVIDTASPLGQNPTFHTTAPETLDRRESFPQSARQTQLLRDAEAAMEADKKDQERERVKQNENAFGPGSDFDPLDDDGFEPEESA